MPRVAIILPTYNRARFLDEAFGSIEAQTFTDWDLIVVDDGSTDDTAAVVARWSARFGDRLRYVKQRNQGAYGARNTGLDHASAPYVAFFDSDDLWLPHHLADCVAALDRTADVDWVYAACRSIDPTGAVVQETTFEQSGHPRPFRSLRTRADGPLHVIVDADVITGHLSYGLFAGLQNSVIRRRVFDGQRFDPTSRVVDDVIFLVRALVRGARIGYLTNVHVIYRIHDDNSSGSSTATNRRSFERIKTETIDALERLDRELPFTPQQRAALRRTLGKHYFWDLGYICYWEAGDRQKAFAAFNRGLRLHPTDVRMWKTYATALARSLLP